MGIYFEDSSPKRKKKAGNISGRLKELEASPIPPPKSYGLLTDAELLAKHRAFAFDCELYPNYFLAAFKCMETGKAVFFEDSPVASFFREKLAYVMFRNMLFGFNSNAFDVPILQCAIKGANAAQLFSIAMDIIRENVRAFEIEQKWGTKQLELNHVDLIEVAPLSASLKMYAGRLHCERMQDLPFRPETVLTQEQAMIVRDYCINDLDNTALLANHLRPQIELREKLGLQFGMELRSKSDAQLAEAIITSELRKLGANHTKPSVDLGLEFSYQAPEWLRFQTPLLQDVLRAVEAARFTLAANGAPMLPKALESRQISIGGGIYRMGIGGLHSSEKEAGHRADANTLIVDRDVASYYPQIILNLELFPKHLGRPFLEVYKSIVQRRLKAKREGDKVVADGFKITANGSFGKFGNRYSSLYSPDLLIQVTITGQLALLMLIEQIELAGIPVISANTDGIVIKCPKDRYSDLERLFIVWEETTGFFTEETRYSSIWSRDVNNYIAVFEKPKDGETCKTKGVYSEKGSALNSPLSKNPESLIIADALKALITDGTPIKQTVLYCKDIRRFVNVRNVKGGAAKDGIYLGKAIRWYYAKGECGTINYVTSGNIVPKSEGARPLMILPAELPNDLDFEYYIAKANEALFDIGYKQRPGEKTLFTP